MEATRAITKLISNPATKIINVIDKGRMGLTADSSLSLCQEHAKGKKNSKPNLTPVLISGHTRNTVVHVYVVIGKS